MTHNEARTLIITALDTALQTTLPTLPVFYENVSRVPMDTVGNAFLKVELDFTGSKQASIEITPLTRNDGELCLWHFQKEGTGTSALLARVDAINAEMKYLTLAGLQLCAPYPGRKEGHDGWFSQEWCIPFWFHSE